MPRSLQLLFASFRLAKKASAERSLSFGPSGARSSGSPGRRRQANANSSRSCGANLAASNWPELRWASIWLLFGRSASRLAPQSRRHQWAFSGPVADSCAHCRLQSAHCTLALSLRSRGGASAGPPHAVRRSPPITGAARPAARRAGSVSRVDGRHSALCESQSRMRIRLDGWPVDALEWRAEERAQCCGLFALAALRDWLVLAVFRGAQVCGWPARSLKQRRKRRRTANRSFEHTALLWIGGRKAGPKRAH